MSQKYAIGITACILLTLGLVAGLFSISANAVTRSTADTEISGEENAGTSEDESIMAPENNNESSGSAEIKDGEIVTNDDESKDSSTSKSKSSSKNKDDAESSDSSTSKSKSSSKNKDDAESSDSSDSEEDSKSSKSSSKSSDKSTSKSDKTDKTDKTDKSDSSDSDTSNKTTKTTKTTTKSSKSSGSSMTDSKGNKLLMTESQRRKRFGSKTNPKRGEKPVIMSTIPKPPINGFVYADFGSCNAYNSDSGLGGSPMYLVGTIMEIEKVYENNSCYGTVLLVNDVDGYQWYMRVEVDKPMYDAFKQQFTGKAGYIFGTNAGYSGVTYRPMLDVVMIAPNGEIPADMALYHTGAAANNALAEAAAAASAENPAPAPEQADQNKTTPAPEGGNTSSSINNNDSSVIASDNFSSIEAVKNTTDKYVLNKDTKKIHNPGCSDINDMLPENAATSNASMEELKAAGYTTCGHCNPN